MRPIENAQEFQTEIWRNGWAPIKSQFKEDTFAQLVVDFDKFLNLDETTKQLLYGRWMHEDDGSFIGHLNATIDPARDDKEYFHYNANINPKLDLEHLLTLSRQQPEGKGNGKFMLTLQGANQNISDYEREVIANMLTSFQAAYTEFVYTISNFLTEIQIPEFGKITLHEKVFGVPEKTDDLHLLQNNLIMRGLAYPGNPKFHIDRGPFTVSAYSTKTGLVAAVTDKDKYKTDYTSDDYQDIPILSEGISALHVGSTVSPDLIHPGYLPVHKNINEVTGQPIPGTMHGVQLEDSEETALMKNPIIKTYLGDGRSLKYLRTTFVGFCDPLNKYIETNADALTQIKEAVK